MKLSIITVSWNVRELVLRLIDSIVEHTYLADYEIIVIDNNSSDGTVEALNEHKTELLNAGKLKLIANDFNAGFAKANNQGLALATGEFVLFMNPDMELTENSLEKLITYLQSHPEAGIVTTKLIYPDGTTQHTVKSLPTLIDQVIILLKLHHFLFFLPAIKKYLCLDFDYSKPANIEQSMGAFILMKHSLARQLHGWDESYWLLWEDVELCRRIRDLNLNIVYLPITAVIHHESRSFAQQASFIKQKRFNRGMLTYFRKHQSRIEVIILRLLQPISLGLAFLTQIFKIKQRPQSRIQ